MTAVYRLRNDVLMPHATPRQRGIILVVLNP